MEALPDTCKPVGYEPETDEAESDYEVCTDSTSSSHEFQTWVRSRSGRYDLYDQLATSPQTRFHAAYLFVRYLTCILGCPNARGQPQSEDEVQSSDLYDGMTLIKWDIAVGCLALSVKASLLLPSI